MEDKLMANISVQIDLRNIKDGLILAEAISDAIQSIQLEYETQREDPYTRFHFQVAFKLAWSHPCPT